MSVCMAPGLQEEAKRLKWGEHKYYQKGIHTPMRFIFWNFNDIVDGTSELNGVGTGGKRQDNPSAFAGNFRIMAEAADRLVDDAITRAKDGAIEIIYVGGGTTCWRSGWRKPDVG
eukprot:7801031-Pyramimonas_sp.AAC.1